MSDLESSKTDLDKIDNDSDKKSCGEINEQEKDSVYSEDMDINGPDHAFMCGVVEGFYGRPWTAEQRKELFRR